MIELREVTKAYGDALALKGVSFEVKKGEIVGFLGPNGAGKTTTMKILTGYIAPSGGEARVNGLDVLEDSLAVRRLIGYLPENAPVYVDMTVGEYLSFMGEARGLRAAGLKTAVGEAAERVALSDRLRQPISALSKGYRQRVGLAQALIHDPPILILDEPTTGLDPNQIVEIRRTIREIGAEKTVILSTHILPEVEATTDRILIINQGAIVADGPTQAIIEGQDQAQLHLQIELPDPGGFAGVSDALMALQGVSRVTLEGEDGRILKLAIRTPSQVDVRREIFALAVARHWVLLEIRRESLGLEALFQRLTGQSTPKEVSR